MAVPGFLAVRRAVGKLTGRWAPAAWGRAHAGPRLRSLCGLLLGMVLGGGVVVGLTGTWNAVVESSAPEAQGRALYAQYCSACHGEGGDRLPLAPLNSQDFLDGRGDIGLLLAVREGKGTMPAWSRERGGPLDDDQIGEVLAHMNSLAGRRSPLSVAAQGKQIYQTACASCHGDQGDRIPAAPLNAREFLAARTDTALAAAIERGKGVMPAQGQAESGTLSTEGVEAVVGFLRQSSVQRQAKLAGCGREIFLQRCVSCHGEQGNKFPNAVLSSPRFLERQGDGLLALAIAQGKGAMPAFSAVKGGPLFPEDVDAVLLFLKSWAGLPVTVTVAGVGAAAESKALFTRNCVPCHGEKGDKVTGVPLLDQGFLTGRGEVALVEAVRKGNRRGMPAWGQKFGGSLAEAQIRAVVGFLIASAGASVLSPDRPDGSRPLASSDAQTADNATRPAAPAAGSPAAAAPTPPAAAAGAPGDAQAGAALFAQSCTSCHGQSRNQMPTAKLGDGAWLQQRGDEALKSSIANGKGGMPAWGTARGGALSDQDITNILAYLKQAAGGGAAGPAGPAGGASAAPQPPPRPPRTEPVVITATTGEELFKKNCVMCHGEDGMRQVTAPLGSRRYVSRKGFDGLVGRISGGRTTAGMPAWSEEQGGPLAREEIKAIVEYLLRTAR
ncbi:MAG: c-type cytochrome [Chloroflexi bacterium]|nr:c-type cytochrome [Chloroflexota bacterium]